jgi:hypothetical protein
MIKLASITISVFSIISISSCFGQRDSKHPDISLSWHKGYSFECIINVDIDKIKSIGYKSSSWQVQGGGGVVYSNSTDFDLQIANGDTSRFIGSQHGNPDDPRGMDCKYISVDENNSNNILIHIRNAEGNPCMRLFVIGKLRYRGIWTPLLTKEDVLSGRSSIKINFP